MRKNFRQMALLITGLILSHTIEAGAKTNTSPRPNILWIMLEDWGTDLSCYGTQAVHTPHIDQLAAEGVRYTRAFTTAPVCSTSRSAMLTGHYQNYTHTNQHRTQKKHILPYGIEPIPLLLSRAGYCTALGCGLSKKTDQNFTNKLGFTANNWTPTQLAGAKQRIITPISIVVCPSRRGAMAFGTSFHGGTLTPRGSEPCERQVRGDYAACSGNMIVEYFSGPATIADAEDYSWGDIDGIATGISFYHSAVKMAQISDGTTHTYLLGEKYINPDSYEDGSDPADNEDLYSGFNNDNHRIAYFDAATNAALTPRQDYPGLRSPRSFGSAHPGSCFMSFCDGSVRAISYDVDPLAHQRMGNRMDGKSVGAN